MKKALVSTAVLLLCLSLLCACQKKEKFIIDGLVEVNVRNDLGVSLTLTPGTLSPTGGEFVLYNESEESFSYTGEYYLNKLTDEGWGYMKPTGDSLIFTLIIQELNMFDSYTMNYDWSRAFGELPAGEYRLIKKITPFQGNSVQEEFYVTCEFTIE